MKTTGIHSAAAALLALAAFPASATLRAWEPKDYATDGLVLHYDGIRNAGENAAHDDSATVWKDLSPSGNDASLVNGPGANGSWGTTGFVFAGSSNLWTAASRTSLSGDFTAQVACDTTTSYMQGTCSWPNLLGGCGKGASGAADELAIFYHKGNKRLSAKFLNAYVGQDLPSWGCKYATLMRKGSQASLFEGTSPSFVSTSKTGDIGSRVMVGDGMDGDLKGAEGRLFTGTIYSIRIYDTALSDSELAWNRALDEARFHGAAVPESAVCADHVPDAVVASAVAGASGAEPAGCYMVDDGGHVFRAAPCAVVSGTSYACTGCTVATWDATLGAYGAAETRDGVYAVSVAPGDKVKITWQWAAASGSIAANPYVADGLVLYYDGEWNAGFGAHNSAATVWKDLSASGNDAEFVYLAPGGGWLDNAYDFQTNGHFQTTSAINLGSSFSVQVATDSRSNPFVGNLWPWFVGSNDGHFQFYPNNSTLNVVLNADGMLGSGHRSQFTWSDSRFLTAMVDANSNLLFQTSISERNWSVGSGPTPLGSQVFAIGGPTKALYPNDSDRTKRSARTPFHAVRIYTKILSADEIARNRAIDEARFFGNGTPASNAVVVASSIAGLSGREPDGLYFPDGWTFAAPSGTVAARGLGWRCTGYQLQTWDAASGTWDSQTTQATCSYASPSAPFATRRLVWLWKPVSGARTAADYAAQGTAEYAGGAVAMHLDGKEHGSSATVWTDLSGNGRDATLTTGGTSAWTADGYAFNGDAFFRTSASFTLGKFYTMQMLVDWNRDDMGGQNRMLLAQTDGVNDGAIWWKNGDGNIFFRGDKAFGTAWSACPAIEKPVTATYLTALRNGAKAAITAGTAHPTTTGTKGQANSIIDWFEGSENSAAPASTWTIGADAQNNQKITACVRSVRLYDRLLSDDELAWNRSVDSARFFGALATTNVVVVANEFSNLGSDTAYEAFGPHVFASSPSGADGSRANFVKVQTLATDGSVLSTSNEEGDSYAYDPSAGTVRIEFRRRNPFVILMR